MMMSFLGILLTHQKGIEKGRKQEYLKNVISKGKAYLLEVKLKWTQGKVDTKRNG